MNKEKFFGMLGLAARARRISAGEGAVLDSIRSGKARLVVLSQDASENTRKRFENSCEHYNTMLVFAEEREALGKSIGREFAVVVSVNDDGFAKSLMKFI